MSHDTVCELTKVLSAVGRGENLMRALEGTMPEDVRGKLTGAVTEILQTQGTKVKFEGLNRIDWIPNITSKIKSRIQETIKEISVHEKGSQESKSGVDHEGKGQGDPVHLSSAGNSMQESIELSKQRISQSPEMLEAVSEPNQSNDMEWAGYVIEETSNDQPKVSQGMADRFTGDDKNNKVLNDSHHIPSSQGKKISS
ncbi:hypothetical protein Cni_G06544 [Canna indica]|uniref:DUF7750 domain-containing protein n=1 Tax=Canna indica TaxID=4628 RepID=A0AAQ3JXF0_9LILI|nr:hypothetical protein Cni_G06544 [Canna indica]